MKFTLGGEMGCTGLEGYIKVPFSKVVEVLGEPQHTDGYKVAFEWNITFEDGTVATIYDYKESNLYDDDLPTPSELIEQEFSDWHIGGTSKKAVELISELFKGYEVEYGY